MKLKIGVFFGEHEISARSAKTIIEQIDREKYEVFPVEITKDGNWLKPFESLNLYDVVFPVLHGTYGEDGAIQGLLEMAEIPYVGCGVLASASAMDKVAMKTLFRDAELPVCKYVWFLRSEWESAQSGVVIKQIETMLGYPCFVKPANSNASAGISRATDAESLTQAIKLAARYDRKIIVEEAPEVREIKCAVTGSDNPQASLPGEYIINDEIGNKDFVVHALISEELVKKIQQMAITAFKAIDGAGLAEVGFFLRNDNGALLVNEIDTMPVLTDASAFPKMWAGSGLEFSKVIDNLVDLAFERHRDKMRNEK